jgi:hypothetical protein
VTVVADLFVLAYVLLALFGDLPGRRLRKILDPVTRVVEWLGFEQHWGMFAPDPPTSDRNLQAILERAEGGAVVWEPPRLHETSRWRGFRQFRYRSYEHAILYDELEPAFEGLAEYLLGKYEADRPAAVTLVSVDREIPPPGEDGLRPPPSRAVLFACRPSRAGR